MKPMPSYQAALFKLPKHKEIETPKGHREPTFPLFQTPCEPAKVIQYHTLLYNEPQKYLNLPIPWEFGRIKIEVRRSNFGFNALFPTFKLALDSTRQVIMIASKRAFNMKANYRITTPTNQDMGKLRCLAKSSDENLYTLFSRGCNPLKKRNSDDVTRSELLQVTYTPHSLYDGMRSTHVLIPAVY